MKLPSLAFGGLTLAAATTLALPPPTSDWRQTLHGLELDLPTGGHVAVEVYTDNILRVRATPLATWPAKDRIMVVLDPDSTDSTWTADAEGNEIVLNTATVQARVDRKTGAVRFLAPDGSPLLAELPDGRSFTPATVLGEATYHPQLRFDASEVEVIHGLGGHQNGIINFKGKDALLLQYNVVDINPFIVTEGGWGLLWDNHSITRFGDPRPYEELDGLTLRGTNGETGGLTATYFAGSDFSEPLASRPEAVQNYEFIENKPGDAPTGFDFETGSIRWEGTIESHESGVHKFQLHGSSYTRLWLDGELLVDRWRQNWMPWTNLFTLDMKPGEQHQLKVEWVCGGGYHALRFLPPEPPELDDQIVFTSEVGEMTDYYFVRGEDPGAVVAGYRKLTGEAPMMPRWAYGYWQSRERYKTQDEVLDTVRQFRDLGFPLDNIVQDWFYWPEDKWGSHAFDLGRFPDAAAMTQTLHDELNAHIMISVWPKFYVGTEHYDEFATKGWLYPRNIEIEEKDWVGPGYVSTFYDAFNEAAGQYFWDTISDQLFAKDFDAWWLDATEADIHSNISVLERQLRMSPTAKGSGAREFNAFSMYNSKAVYEGQRADAPDQRVFILTRSAFAGQQRFATATWSGDVASRWEDLAKQIPAGLNFVAAGIPYWTTDIGGFSVEPRYEDPDAADLAEWRELNLRWFQYGTFCPLFRSHGQFPYREPFNIAPPGHPVYEAMLRYARFRYRLMPYIYSLGGAVTQEGATLMRPLLFGFPKDLAAAEVDDAFLFGPSLMVAPVTSYHATERDVYLPKGADWYFLKTGERMVGGQTVTVPAPLEDLALFVPTGSILLLGPDEEYVGEKPADSIEIRVYPGADADFTLYEDDGLSYAYERGQFSTIRFHWNDADRKLEIGERTGSFDGMLQARQFRVVDGSKLSQKDTFEASTSPDAVVSYDGSATAAKL